MAPIGNFTVNGNGFVGTVKTLALGTVKTKIDPAYFPRVLEIGCIWRHLAAREGLEDDLCKSAEAPESRAYRHGGGCWVRTNVG